MVAQFTARLAAALRERGVASKELGTNPQHHVDQGHEDGDLYQGTHRTSEGLAGSRAKSANADGDGQLEVAASTAVKDTAAACA